MINGLFKKTQKVDSIENGRVNHYFKITFLNNTVKVFDNYGNEIEKSKITNNNNKEANNVITYPSTKK
tara:strand:- start:405 stop:608 length:204 start_codon:yes stop_codon:yes gene_type:complete